MIALTSAILLFDFSEISIFNLIDDFVLNTNFLREISVTYLTCVMTTLFFTLILFIGMEDGHKITFSGEGDQEPGLEPGDIVIVLDEKEHEIFKRSLDKLILKMELTLTEALCGFRKTIQTLDARNLVISNLPGKISLLAFIVLLTI